MPPPGRSPQKSKLADVRKLVGKSVAARYHVKQVIGVGGKGTVYEAEDKAMSRLVALKVPLASSEDAIKRFLREGRAGASVAHPNVCSIYDFGPLEDGTPFLVMERLFGEPLSDHFARRPKLPLTKAVALLQQVLAGLEAAHAQGIIDRDIKPANIFLSGKDDPIAKVIDFGASTLGSAQARVKANFEELTKMGTAIGTPIYMSPEQVRGQRDLDARVDLYACGVIFYQALTGVVPYNVPSRVELFRLIAAGKFKPASEIEPRLLPEVDEILERALASDRARRYPDAAAFSNALDSLRFDNLEAVSRWAPEPVDDGERLKALQQRLAEMSSLYVESVGGMRAAKRMNTGDIPIDIEFETEELPENTIETSTAEETHEIEALVPPHKR